MPYSTGSSDDSGYSGVRTNNRFYSSARNDSCCFPDFATSSIACSDDDDDWTNGFRFYGGRDINKMQGGRNNKRRSRKNKAEQRRYAMQLPRPASTPNSISSSCSSEPDSLEDDSRFLHSSDSVFHLCMYFQSLLLNIRRQQRFFEQIARIIGDGDARWGAHGHKNGWKFDPSGCYAPLAYGDQSKPAFFPGCWAVPHPVVYLELLSEYIQDYLVFLKRTYPASRQSSRFPGDESGQRFWRSGEKASISPEEMIPTLIKFVQQQTNGCSPVERNEEGALPVLSSTSWPTVSSGHVTPNPSLDSPCKQNYSAVVSRSPSDSKNGAISYSAKAAASVFPTPTESMAHSESHQFKDQRTSAVVPGSATTVASAASSPRNDNSLTATKTRPPTPPPTAPVDGKGNFEVSKMDVLSEQIWHYHNSITQTDNMLNRKLSLRDMLYYTISPVFPMCGLYVVGSSLNGFGNNTSDMDLCLMITNKDLDQRTDAVVVLNLILSTLAQLDWVDTQHLILAKVPILRIKFNAPFQDITVDLNANNSVAIRNTHLLCYYSSFDWRVRPLVSVVKEWAKKKGINDANRSSFTSYSLVLMVIHYLQSGADQVILPSLQAMYPKRFHHRVDVRTLNVSQKLPPVTEGWEYHGKASLGELFIGFLNYYANKFNFDHHAISVRQGRRVDRATIVGQNNSKGNWSYQWKCICIEEPFTLSNTAHSVYDEMVFGAIKGAFREAHAELEKNRDLHSLLECKPINVSLQHNGAVVYHYDNSSVSSSQDVVSSGSSLATARSGSSNSVGSDDSDKSQSFDRTRRKGSSARGGGPSKSSYKQQLGRKASTGQVSSAAASPLVSC